jgi:hypothetical protein
MNEQMLSELVKIHAFYIETKDFQSAIQVTLAMDVIINYYQTVKEDENN